jgi:hypothetical protein
MTEQPVMAAVIVGAALRCVAVVEKFELPCSSKIPSRISWCRDLVDGDIQNRFE